jgi:hypothetical protein
MFLFNILWSVGWYTPLIRWVIIRTIRFISACVTHLLLMTLTQRQYSATFLLLYLQFTVSHALWYSVSNRRFPATDLVKQTTTVLLNNTFQVSHTKCTLRRCVLAARILTVVFVVCTLAVKKKKIRTGFDMSDRIIPLLALHSSVRGATLSSRKTSLSIVS